MGANWVLLPIFGQRIFPIHHAGLTSSEAGMLGMSLLMAFRGVGAILGPIVSGYWAAGRERRMRWGILFGYLAGAAGYLALGRASNLALACAGIALAHAGGSTLWVFSSTLLQLQTEDRFRGRVFSAEWAFSVVTMSFSSYSAGALIDRSMPAPAVACLTGLVVLVPAVLWALTLKSRSAAPSATCIS
jgi:hypothetical protein